MTSAALTPERIAELRRLLAEAPGEMTIRFGENGIKGPPAWLQPAARFYNAARRRLSAILDALAASQAECEALRRDRDTFPGCLRLTIDVMADNTVSTRTQCDRKQSFDVIRQAMKAAGCSIEHQIKHAKDCPMAYRSSWNQEVVAHGAAIALEMLANERDRADAAEAKSTRLSAELAGVREGLRDLVYVAENYIETAELPGGCTSDELDQLKQEVGEAFALAARPATTASGEAVASAWKQAKLSGRLDVFVTDCPVPHYKYVMVSKEGASLLVEGLFLEFEKGAAPTSFGP